MWYFILLLFLRLQVYPLHSSVTLEEQNNVFLSPVPGYRKVGGREDEAWDIIVLSGELRCLGSFPVCPRLPLSHSGKSYWWEFVPFLVVHYFVNWFYEKLRFLRQGIAMLSRLALNLRSPCTILWSSEVIGYILANSTSIYFFFFWIKGWGFAVLGVGALSEAVVWVLGRLLAVLFVFSHYSLQLPGMTRVWDLSFWLKFRYSWGCLDLKAR